MILYTRDVLDLPVKIVENSQDTHLLYGEVWLCEDPTQGHMVRVDQEWVVGSVEFEFPV